MNESIKNICHINNKQLQIRSSSLNSICPLKLFSPFFPDLMLIDDDGSRDDEEDGSGEHEDQLLKEKKIQ